MTTRLEPVWLRADALVMLTSQSIMLHGGSHGSVKQDLLESALFKVQHVWHYEQIDDIASLAAVYGAGISQNHPFTDGNKRAAYLAIGLFLDVNGWMLTADMAESVHVIIALAKSGMTQDMLATWIRNNMEPIV